MAAESARRIIKGRLQTGLSPRPKPTAFAREILGSDIEKYKKLGAEDRPVFFDRGVLDALYMLDSAQALSRDDAARYVQRFPYNDVVFLLPPWEEIYSTDSERDQLFQESVSVFEGMKRWYARWGYKVVEVPKMDIKGRILFILDGVDDALTNVTGDRR